MPITPRNHTNFKEDLIELIKLRYEDSIDTNNIFFLKDKPFIGYGFSLKDDIDTICDQIYGKKKNKELVDAVKKAIADFKLDETKSESENAALLYENINKAAEDSKKVSKSPANQHTSSSNPNTAEAKNSLPEFKFTSEDQKCFILEQKLKPLVQEIDKKLSGSPLKKLGEVALAASNQTSGQSITPSKEHVALLALLYLSDKKELNASLVTYVKTKSRFRAWYWLAYESFDGKRDDKLDKIRERISTVFGLFEHDAYNENLNNLYSSLGNQTDFSASNLTSVGTEHIGFRECIDVFSHLNVTKIKYYEKDEKGEESAQENTCLEFIKTYEINKIKPNTAGSVAPNLNNSSLNKNLSSEKQDPSLSKSGAELGDASAASKQEALFKPFADKLNSLLSSHTSKTFSLENIYCINLTLAAVSNASRINKLLRKREEELYKQENILILCPIKTATPIKIFQPKKSDFTIVLASQTPFDCSELNPKELNPSRANYGKVNLCELLLTDFIFNPYENSNTDHTAQSPSVSTTEEIKFKNAKTSSESLDPFTGKFASSDTVTLYRGEDGGDNENKSEASNQNSSNDKTKPKNPYFTSIRRDEEEIEYKLKEGMIEMSCFKQSGNLGSNDSNSASNQTSPYLNFTLLNFAKENNFTLRDDKASAMFDMKLLLAYGNEAVPTSYSNSNFTLTVQDLIIENENGEATHIDKVYLHNCSNKTAYQSSSLVKNQDSLFKNSYTATFNIPIDKDNKKDTKLIIYSNDLSKTHTTKDIHKRSDTAVISLSYKDKNNQSFCYLRKTSLRDITNNIINVISDNEYPFKTNEDITLKAIYKQEEKDEQGNDNKKYKEVVWGYKVIKTIEYNEVSKSNPKDVVELKDKKGKEITFKISDVIKKDDLDKLKQGGHSIIFFAALKDKENKDKQQNDKSKDTKEVKFQFNTNYGKTHMRVDIKIPLYIKFKDDRVIIYEFEHAIKEKVFKASLNHDDVLVNRSGYLYINKDISSQDINIYEDDKLSKELKVKSEDGKADTDKTLNKNYRIYIDEANSSNNQNQSDTNQVQSQTDQTNINQDTKYGINLLSKDNMDKFISSFNESKSITRVDKGMWEDGDEGVKVLIDIKDYPFTLSMLKQVFTDIKKDQEYILQEMVDELNRRDIDGIQMYIKYKLDTRHRLEHFFGQCVVEVGSSFHELTESLNYSAKGLMSFSYFKNHPDEAEQYGRKEKFEGKKKIITQKANQEIIANIVYADENRPKDLRLGNVQEGDGWKYRGRGMIQITGREIYTDFNTFAHEVKLVGDEISFVDNPELVAENKTYAFVSAAFFWIYKYKMVYKIADESKADSENEDVVNKVTSIVNNKADKQKRINSYKRIREANIFKKFK